MENQLTVQRIFDELTNFIVHKIKTENTMRGACHSSSAILYILLSEAGFEPKIKIGVVHSDYLKSYSDHSWIELDNKIYDIAIAYQNYIPPFSAEPIFESKTRFSDKAMNVRYAGYTPPKKCSKEDNETREIMRLNLRKYNKKTIIDIWSISLQISEKLGMKLKRDNLIERYGKTRREIVE